MTLEIKSDIITGYVPFIESMGVANVLERIIKKQDEIIQHINKVEIKDRKAIRQELVRLVEDKRLEQTSSHWCGDTSCEECLKIEKIASSNQNIEDTLTIINQVFGEK